MMFLRSLLVLVFGLMAGITYSEAQAPLKVVTTIGQITDAVEVIGSGHLKVEGLMGPGVDPHLYKASEHDVRKLAGADIIFYNGLFLEAKMADIFARMQRSAKTVAVGEAVAPESLLDSEQYTGHYDPHIWFDVRLWMQVVQKIRDELVLTDPSHREQYVASADAYLSELQKLHDYVTARAAELPEEKRVLVTAHDAFRYFGRAYGFKVIGLQGISTQSEAGTADVRKLADFIAENKIKAIFIESSVPERNLRAVQQAVAARGWDVKIGGELFSDAMGDKGTFEGTYIGMVTHNIDTIVDALR
jgi:manganese/zinc/iron transport system substrate-binding protein